MTPNRRTLLEYVWSTMYTQRCPCGRCDCASSDPVALAQRVLSAWGQAYLRLAGLELERAQIYGKPRRGITTELRRELGYDVKHAAHLRTSRRFERAALRFVRLARGLPPFVAHPEDPQLVGGEPVRVKWPE